VNLQANYGRFLEQQAVILALAVQDVGRARQMADIAQASFPILADPDHAVADRYGVFNLLGDGVAAPAVFVIDPGGRIVWYYIGRSAADRPPVDDIVAQLTAGRQ
jgi:thioredoxin-dependent peroxiredoxin